MKQSQKQALQLALLVPITVPVTLGILMLPSRLLLTAFSSLRASPWGSALALVWVVAALAGTIAVHVKMWRSFMRRDADRQNPPAS